MAVFVGPLLTFIKYSLPFRPRAKAVVLNAAHEDHTRNS